MKWVCICQNNYRIFPEQMYEHINFLFFDDLGINGNIMVSHKSYSEQLCWIEKLCNAKIGLKKQKSQSLSLP